MTERFSLNAFQIKCIAVFAMLLDHIAWSFLPATRPAGEILHLLGRTTAPVMCFFLVEGYHRTHSLKRYFIRLGICAAISHFAFRYFQTGDPLSRGTDSMILTLMICLLCMCVLHSKKIPAACRLPLCAGLALLADLGDWGKWAVLFTLTFARSRESGKAVQALAYALAVCCYFLPMLLGERPFHMFMLGLFLPVPLLLSYNGERGASGKWSKWAFYVFYPLHLTVLGFLRHEGGILP